MRMKHDDMKQEDKLKDKLKDKLRPEPALDAQKLKTGNPN
jgi:hypothetical protein